MVLALVTQLAPFQVSILFIIVLNRVTPMAGLGGRCAVLPAGIPIPAAPANNIKLPSKQIIYNDTLIIDSNSNIKSRFSFDGA
jgi:hypothetical protein